MLSSKYSSFLPFQPQYFFYSLLICFHNTIKISEINLRHYKVVNMSLVIEETDKKEIFHVACSFKDFPRSISQLKGQKTSKIENEIFKN